MKNILAFFQVLIGLYFLGDLIRQNPKIDGFLQNTEKKFSNWNHKLKDSNAKSVLFLLKKIHGYLSIIFIIIFLVIQKLWPSQIYLLHLLSAAFVACIFVWLSLTWTIDHKNMIISMAKQVAFLSVTPFIAGIMDYLFSLNFTAIFVQIYNTLAQTLHLEPSGMHHPIIMGLVGSLILTSLFVIYYIIMWVISLPTLLIFLLFMLSAQRIAKLINSIAPKQPLMGLAVILFIILTFVQANI
ncbi:hypothetical protein [Acinetobacter sp. Ver3]|uniref:hypothetical protein n=1 Tax=Acinetobacter sp. Ver3 TaxID=466088 RepID=UPI0004465224|nr:hypothetical protein [Acinetobacter sp. Ver3]EZQ01313.1 hypothetical protein CL42_14335 [Acinetobacter sp. Ver3]